MPTPKQTTPEARRLGRNIARSRTVAGLTQEQLAEQAGISTRYVQDMERGLYTPTVFIANRLRQALKVTWEDLLKGC
jgi:putative transcriptional regulator